ncbi:MAG: tetratricopeptide repeat protein [Ferruginibacter sp.]
MMKQILPVLLFLLFFSAAEAQVNNAAFYYRSGIQLRNENKFPEALAAFNKAVSLNSKFDSAYVELGNIYSKSGNIDPAISNYKKALAINPKYVDALIGIGKLYRDAKHDFDSTLIYYHAAARLDSTTIEIFYGLAWTYNARKDYDSAIFYGVKALKIDNNYRPAYGELGHAYRSSKKYAECVEQLKKNLAISVVDVAYLYSAFAYMELKDKAAALQQYEELKKINEKMATLLKKKIDTME